MSRHHLARVPLARAGLVILAALAVAGCVVAPGYGRYHPMAYDGYQQHPAAFDHGGYGYGYGYGYAQPQAAYARPVQRPGFWH